MLGLPDGVSVCLFDLDGVLTETATVHTAAWKQVFDDFLSRRADAGGDGDTRPFSDDDYLEFVDGKPRADGVRDFLASRGITLPEGDDNDAADAQTVTGLGTKKNQLLVQLIERDGVTVFPGSRRYLEAARDAGLTRIVVSSSANTEQVLRVTGLDELVEGRVDGVTIRDQHLRGKPAPDPFLAGAQLARVTPREAAVFEDATSGVQAGHAGGFAAVIGVNRRSGAAADEHAAALRSHGATVVVSDLADLLGEDA